MPPRRGTTSRDVANAGTDPSWSWVFTRTSSPELGQTELHRPPAATSRQTPPHAHSRTRDVPRAPARASEDLNTSASPQAHVAQIRPGGAHAAPPRAAEAPPAPRPPATAPRPPAQRTAPPRKPSAPPPPRAACRAPHAPIRGGRRKKNRPAATFPRERMALPAALRRRRCEESL
nr:uncharacterized protein LOC127309924 [Lolium perenne]